MQQEEKCLKRKVRRKEKRINKGENNTKNKKRKGANNKKKKQKEKKGLARAFAGISTGKMPILGLKDCCEYVY